MTLTAWALTTGEAGMRTQARGLALAVADRVIEKIAPRLFRRGTGGQRPASARFAPPWPDVIISCGRRSALWSVALRAGPARGALGVHVQHPRLPAILFDLVLPMEHDRIAAGPKVLKVGTAVHDLTATGLEAAAEAWRDRLAPLGSPLVGVLVGGSLKGRDFSTDDVIRLTTGLRRLRSAGFGVVVTPSRRTPPAARASLAAAFADDARAWVWDLEGDNPYRGILALADRLVVTSDSVSMVSEALFAPGAVELFDLDFSRHRGFVGSLLARRYVRRFEGDPSAPVLERAPDATEEAAAAVKALIQARTG